MDNDKCFKYFIDCARSILSISDTIYIPYLPTYNNRSDMITLYGINRWINGPSLILPSGSSMPLDMIYNLVNIPNHNFDTISPLRIMSDGINSYIEFLYMDDMYTLAPSIMSGCVYINSNNTFIDDIEFVPIMFSKKEFCDIFINWHHKINKCQYIIVQKKTPDNSYYGNKLSDIFNVMVC